MIKKRTRLASLALASLIASAALFSAGTARAATLEIRAADPVEKATVNLYCRFRSGRKSISASGSGVFISERGVILTNAHVAQYFLLAEEGRVRGTCSVRTGSPAHETYTASVLYFPSAWADAAAGSKDRDSTGENDFALLYVTGSESGVLPARFSALPVSARAAAEGDRVTVAGYPIENLGFDEIRRRLARIEAESSVTSIGSFGRSRLPDLITVASSPAGSSGISGGPVIAEPGTLIGIAATKSTARGDRTLRALSLGYIDRMIRSETGFPLASILGENLAIRALVTNLLLKEETVDTLERNLLKNT